MALPALTEEIIRQHASAASVQAGQAYYRDGAVVSLVRRGNALEARVEGSDPEPYRVLCSFDEAGIRDASCTCLYAYGGWCKHIVATVLAVVHGDTIEDRRPLDEVLAELGRDRLQRLVLQLVQRDPDLQDAIETTLQLDLEASTDGGRARFRPPNLDAVRKHMLASLHHASDRNDRGWYVFHLGPEASELLEQVWALIHAGEGRIAMDMLNAMTDECLESWGSIMEDEEGETLSFVQEELGPAWTEAILCADLTTDEREGWEAKLEAWASDLADYGNSDSFEVALKALQVGWDDPELRRTLRGEVEQRKIGEFEDYYDHIISDRLTLARLNTLERQSRYDEYLNLARAEGQVARYTTMLARQGRTADATEYGVVHLQHAEDALLLAQRLREVGHLEESARVGERGLELEGRKTELGAWLADLASGLGKQELAFRAATAAFREEMSLTSYVRAQAIAGEAWPGEREEFLNYIRQSHAPFVHGPIDILLHENLVDDAIALLERTPYIAPHIIRQVAGAAMTVNPEWVIRASRKQAEGIMSEGRVKRVRGGRGLVGHSEERVPGCRP